MRAQAGRIGLELPPHPGPFALGRGEGAGAASLKTVEHPPSPWPSPAEGEREKLRRRSTKRLIDGSGAGVRGACAGSWWWPARGVGQAWWWLRGVALVRQGSEVDREMPFVCKGFMLFYPKSGEAGDIS